MRIPEQEKGTMRCHGRALRSRSSASTVPRRGGLGERGRFRGCNTTAAVWFLLGSGAARHGPPRLVAADDAGSVGRGEEATGTGFGVDPARPYATLAGGVVVGLGTGTRLFEGLGARRTHSRWSTATGVPCCARLTWDPWLRRRSSTTGFFGAGLVNRSMGCGQQSEILCEGTGGWVGMVSQDPGGGGRGRREGRSSSSSTAKSKASD